MDKVTKPKHKCPCQDVFARLGEEGVAALIAFVNDDLLEEEWAADSTDEEDEDGEEDEQ